MKTLLIHDEDVIKIQKSVINSLKIDSANMSAPTIQAMLLQKIHEACYNSEVHDDGFKWVLYHYKELSDWSSFGVHSIRTQLQKLINKGLIITKDAYIKTGYANFQKVWYRINYDKLTTYIKTQKKRIEKRRKDKLNKVFDKYFKGVKNV